jgi:hypothetical protein
MARKLRNVRAKHEASHAVIARKFGLHVACVDARSDNPNVTQASAAYAAAEGLDDVAALIAGYEKDAIVALAGHEANRRDYPDLRVFDVMTEDEDADTLNARSSIYRIACLMSGQPVPLGPVSISADQVVQGQMYQIYFRLRRETASLVERHWQAIERVAKHLERHGRIDDQRQLDDLIERAERVAFGPR